MEQSEIARYTAMYSLATDKERRSYIFATNRINRRHIRELAEAVGIEPRRSLYVLALELSKYFKQVEPPVEEPKPEPIPEPEIEEPEPTFECVGCGGLTEAKGLRWKKLGEGQPVTVTIDHSGKPASLGWLTDEVIMKEWFEPWAKRNPVVQFELLKSGKGDCHIKWERVDGQGNTLAYVWQPAGSVEAMESGGSLAGDMVVDSSERSYPPALVHEAGKHEVGHVLGIGHLNSTRDVMYPTARGQKKPLSTNDKREEDQRYPFKND